MEFTFVDSLMLINETNDLISGAAPIHMVCHTASKSVKGYSIKIVRILLIHQGELKFDLAYDDIKVNYTMMVSQILFLILPGSQICSVLTDSLHTILTVTTSTFTLITMTP